MAKSTIREMSVIEIATHRDQREGDRKQWLRLSPNLLTALEALAKHEGLPLELLLSDLITEALTHRALVRQFRPNLGSEDAKLDEV